MFNIILQACAGGRVGVFIKSMGRLGLVLCLLGLLAGLSPAARAQAGASSGPSFACAGAQDAVARAICANGDLAAADRTMAALYAVAKISAFGAGPANELAAQRVVLKHMRGCAGSAAHQPIAQCLRREYDRRNEELAIAVLMRAPNLALPVLRETDPAYAPLLEAVQIWGAEAREANWAAPTRAGTRARISRLLGPFMASILTRDDQSFGREILSDGSNGTIAVRHLDDIFLSEKHFAAFLNVQGPYIDATNWKGESVSGRRSLPCAAIIAHPALLGATSGVFGSSMDGLVFDNDCAQTLPPMPALDTLDGKLTKAWPPCDGTIRFAAYRNYQSALDAARLGMVQSDVHPPPYPRRRGETEADVAAARTELAVYYVANLHKSPTAAAGMAIAALNAILGSAQECD